MLNEVMNGITVALPFVVGVGGVGVLASGYVKASPDTALIISGLRKKPKVLIGKAGIKVPFFERMDKLSLKLIPLDIKTGDAVPTADCINIYVDSAVNVKVGSTSEMVEIAAQNFLNKSTEEIGDIVTEVLEGNIREIICTMKLRELIGDRKTFVEKVSENVIPDLKKMGLELVSFNVQRFSDENHVINDLGIDNISQIKKDAAIAKANADKEVEIAKAKASKEANDARVQSEAEIAIKQNELDIKKAELKKESDIKKAEADAAYTIQEEEQRKTVEITTAKKMYFYSKKTGIPLIAGTDTHSSSPYKAECRKILQKYKDSFYGEEDEFDLTWKTYEELIAAFKAQNCLPEEVYMEAIRNTNVLADMVEEFTLDKAFKYPTLYGDNVREQWRR